MNNNEGAFSKMFKGTLGLAAGLLVASIAAGALSGLGILAKKKLQDNPEPKEKADEAAKAEG